MQYIEQFIEMVNKTPSVLIYLLVLALGYKFLCELFLWFVEKIGLETRTGKEKKEQKKALAEHETKLNEMDAKFVALYNANRVILGDRINQKYKNYLRKGYVPVDEFDELVDLHDTYKSLGGNHSGDLKFNKCMELPQKEDEDIINYNKKVVRNDQRKEK